MSNTWLLNVCVLLFKKGALLSWIQLAGRHLVAHREGVTRAAA